MNKYLIANRCPYGLPKTTSGKQWAKLVTSGEQITKLGGVVVTYNRAGEVVVAVVGYFSGSVLMIEMAALTGSRFERSFTGEETQLLQQWQQDWMSGKYQEAVDAFNKESASSVVFIADMGSGYGF